MSRHRPEVVSAHVESTGEILYRPRRPDGEQFPDRRPVNYGAALAAAAAFLALVLLTGAAAWWIAGLGGGAVWHG